MKEYICKDDLLEKLEEEEYAPANWNDEDLEIGQVNQYHLDLKAIKSCPTVTKADIVNEFVNYYMEDYLDCNKCNRDDDFCCIKCFRDKYLAEMESVNE